MYAYAMGAAATLLFAAATQAGTLTPLEQPKSALKEFSPARASVLEPLPATSELKEIPQLCCELEEWPHLKEARGLIPFET
ncbi:MULTISPECIES: hypothetical protein [Pseudovibrio]|uniref:hypothetical protein n=1 Tax=Stappiaceae TaxID=2821832 RepID=UPI002367197B|nr:MULTISPECIES: hypothetical protein [Pseudovibrio]MDD7909318.1 hypothetical protein [Pseudovibrio exalbescens]MDX5594878.1 hypothetical protein [Pseudovibrio sp. SPO723]